MLQLYRFFRDEKGLEHKLGSLCYNYTAFFAMKKV